MIFIVLSIIVPLFIYLLLPRVVSFLSGKSLASQWPLVVGGIIYFISWYIPSPEIDGINTYFFTHLVGGGLFSGFVWVYIKNHLHWKLSPILELITLYLLVSGLGVANELFEFVLNKLGSSSVIPLDAWWDLVANTLGAVVFWVGYRLWKMIQL